MPCLLGGRMVIGVSLDRTACCVLFDPGPPKSPKNIQCLQVKFIEPTGSDVDGSGSDNAFCAVLSWSFKITSPCVLILCVDVHVVCDLILLVIGVNLDRTIRCVLFDPSLPKRQVKKMSLSCVDIVCYLTCLYCFCV